MGHSAKAVSRSTNDELRRLGYAVDRDVARLSAEMLGNRASIQGYEDVPEDVLRPGNEFGLHLAVRRALLDDDPRPIVVDDIIEMLRPRVAAGLTVDAAVRGAFNGMRQLAEHTRTVAARLRISNEATIDAVTRIWDFADESVAALATAFQALERERIDAKAQRVAAFLHDALLGRVGEDTILQGAAQLALDVDRPYIPFRARTDPTDVRGVVRTWWCVLDGDVVGIVEDRSGLERLDVAVGVGDLATISGMSDSFRLASLALTAAHVHGWRGVFDIDDVGLRAAIVHDTVLTARFGARYLDPLEGLGAFGRSIEASLRAYLDHGLRPENAARALRINHNTLRYRLRRFEEITGADLTKTETAFEIWWALEYRNTTRNASPHQCAS